MDPSRGANERRVGHRGLHCGSRYWRRANCTCLQRSSVRRPRDFLHRYQRQCDVCRFHARRSRRQRSLQRRRSQSRPRTSTVRILEVYRWRRDVYLGSPETTCLNPTLANSAGIIQATFGTTRGVNHIEVDPSDPNTVYAAAFPRNNALPINTGGGVWRSNDGGATWTQIKSARNATNNTDRAEFAVTKLPSGTTRMYVGIGNSSTSSANAAHFYRSDDVATGSPVFRRHDHHAERELLHQSVLV